MVLVTPALFSTYNVCCGKPDCPDMFHTNNLSQMLQLSALLHYLQGHKSSKLKFLILSSQYMSPYRNKLFWKDNKKFLSVPEAPSAELSW